MAKGSVRKKGKKWYYRFYVENESGNLVQKEYAGTESKVRNGETSPQGNGGLRGKEVCGKDGKYHAGEMLDIWLEEEVKPGTLSTGTLIAYTTTARQIKKHPIGQRKLKSITADHLQEYIDFPSFWRNKTGLERRLSPSVKTICSSFRQSCGARSGLRYSRNAILLLIPCSMYACG